MKKGYIIRLSDGEMEALRLLVHLGGEDHGAGGALSRGGKRAMRGRFALHAAMDMDEDRRGLSGPGEGIR